MSRSTDSGELLSPGAAMLLMVGGCVALFLLATSSKKPPAVRGDVVGAKKKRTDEDIARHWDRMAQELEEDARNPKFKATRASSLELAAEYRARAARTRAGKGAWSLDD